MADVLLKLNELNPIFCYDNSHPPSLEMIRIIRSLVGKIDVKNPDIIVVVGGDGTMLNAVSQYWDLGLNFLGLKTGRVGFFMNNIVLRKLEQELSSKMLCHQLPLLSVSYTQQIGDNMTTHESVALNEAHIRNATAQAGRMDVLINGHKKGDTLIGDGVLLATPVGSHGYARSITKNGGLPLDSSSLRLVAHNIIDPDWGKEDLPNSCRVKFKVLEPNKRSMAAFIDSTGPLLGVTSMNVRLSSKSVGLLYTPDNCLARKCRR